MLILLNTAEHEAPTDSQTKKSPQSKPDRTRRKQLEKTTYVVIFLDFTQLPLVDSWSRGFD